MIQQLVNLLPFFAANEGDACDLKSGGFFGFPTWYQYLNGVYVNSDPKDSSSSLICSQAPQIAGINDVWLILAAAISILLRIAAIAAVGAIIYGAVTYMTSQGEPDKTGQAKGTIVNAVVGLAVSVMAAIIVTFIAGKIQ
ncbi:MAG: hypothetical protein JWL89_570 [Candidatus Saccharibacteria bacterium]|nr:hypothetical protein [Candidatus Saccharibacteria bacterium]